MFELEEQLDLKPMSKLEPQETPNRRRSKDEKEHDEIIYNKLLKYREQVSMRTIFMKF